MVEARDAVPDITKAREMSGELDSETLSGFAKIGIRQLRRASMSYTDIRRLFKPTITEEEMEPAELVGSDWKWKFIRRPAKKGVDVEIRKFPLSGQSLLEHAVRLRWGASPLVRSDKVTRNIGPEGHENDEEAITEVRNFITELLTQF